MDISDAPQYENALHQHEILLRNRGFSTTAQLSELTDIFDSIDLTSNEITAITTQFPHLPRLKTLILAQNRIQEIDRHTSASFPNITALSLAQNFISDPAQLEFLGLLPKLTHLCLEGNPITSLPEYRRSVITLQPRLRYLDFKRVTEKERAAALSGPVTDEGKQRHTELLKRLETATSMDEIDLIEQELATLLDSEKNSGHV